MEFGRPTAEHDHQCEAKHYSVSSLIARVRDAVGTANCIQVKVSSPPGQQNPNSTYTVPDGHIESRSYFITTPDLAAANAKIGQNCKTGCPALATPTQGIKTKTSCCFPSLITPTQTFTYG